jgi:MFS family permease
MTGQSLPRYRWAILAAAAAMLGIGVGQLVNGLSPFFAPLETAYGWSRGEIALINTAGLLGLAIGGIVMGGIADRVNIRWVALCGALVTSLALLAASRATALWQLYALMFGAGLLGGGALFAPLFALVGKWFPSGAGLAIGIASAGQAVGQGLMPLANGLLIDGLGWRGALLAMGLFSAATLVPLALVLRPPRAPATNAHAAPCAPSQHALPLGTVLVVLSAAVLCCCSLMSVPLMHLVPQIETCGFSAPEAGSVLMVMMLLAIAGRVAFGRLADRIGPIPAYLTASCWQTALVFLFVRIDDIAALHIFAAVYGFGYAGVMTGMLTTIRALTPETRRAGATGLILAFAWVGHGLGGFSGGALYDLTGAYRASFGLAAAAGLANLAIVVPLWLWSRAAGRTRPGFAHTVPAGVPAASTGMAGLPQAS